MSVNPLVAPVHDSTRWYTGLGLVEDAADITHGIRNNSWVDGSLGGVGASLDLLSLAVDPLGALASWGVAWLMEHVQPLKDALDWLAGNADEVASHAATWANVAAFTEGSRQEYADRLRTEVAGWFGASGDAYRKHAGLQMQVLEGISKAAEGISSAVEGAGLLVAAVRGIVRDLIADFVGTLAARLPQWLAAEGLTLGIATPVVIGQVGALVAKWVNRIQGFVRGLLSSLRRLSPMLDRLAGIIGTMTPDESVRAAAARLAAVDWERHGYRTWSKAKLMLEYFRRIARWLDAYGWDEPVPFFDLAVYLDPDVRADPEVVDEAVQRAAPGGWNAQQMVPFILHWAALRATPGFSIPEGLEDPFEPLLLLFERDGGFHTANGYAEMEHLSVPIAKWRQRATRPPLASLEPDALDEIDRAGSMKQFGYVMGPED